MNIEKAAGAIHDLLALHNIPGRDKVKVVLVMPNLDAKYRLIAAIREDVRSPMHAFDRINKLADDEFMYDGVRFAVRVPKQTIEV